MWSSCRASTRSLPRAHRTADERAPPSDTGERVGDRAIHSRERPPPRTPRRALSHNNCATRRDRDPPSTGCAPPARDRAASSEPVADCSHSRWRSAAEKPPLPAPAGAIESHPIPQPPLRGNARPEAPDNFGYDRYLFALNSAASSLAGGVSTSTGSAPGNRKSGGSTPITAYWRPSSVIGRPMIFGSAPKRLRHISPVRIATWS